MTILLLLALGQDPEVAVGEARTDADGVVHLPLRSSAQSKPTTVRLLAPKGPAKAWLWLLPVEAEGDAVYGDGIAEARKLGLHEKHGWIVAEPGFAKLPWYADHPTEAGRRDETHFLKAVLPAVEARWPLATPKRLLLGFSKSGWGAWSLLLRNSGLFEAAVAWDTPFMEEKPEKYGMGPAFGTPENFEKYRIAALLRSNAESLRDRKRLGHLGYGNFRGHHQKLQALLEELRIPVEQRDGPKRPHAWGGGWLEEAAGVLAALGG